VTNGERSTHGELRIAYNILVDPLPPQETLPLEKPGRKWNENIEMDIKEDDMKL
jgi:hypothetical protein